MRRSGGGTSFKDVLSLSNSSEFQYKQFVDAELKVGNDSLKLNVIPGPVGKDFFKFTIVDRRNTVVNGKENQAYHLAKKFLTGDKNVLKEDIGEVRTKYPENYHLPFGRPTQAHANIFVEGLTFTDQIYEESFGTYQNILNKLNEDNYVRVKLTVDNYSTVLGFRKSENIIKFTYSDEIKGILLRKRKNSVQSRVVNATLELQRSLFLENKPDVLLFTIKLKNGKAIQGLGRLDFMTFEFKDTTKDGYVVKLYDENGVIRLSINMLNEDFYNNNISRTWNDGEIFLWENITASVPSDDPNIVPKRSEYLKHYYLDEENSAIKLALNFLQREIILAQNAYPPPQIIEGTLRPPYWYKGEEQRDAQKFLDGISFEANSVPPVGTEKSLRQVRTWYDKNGDVRFSNLKPFHPEAGVHNFAPYSPSTVQNSGMTEQELDEKIAQFGVLRGPEGFKMIDSPLKRNGQ
jgi:hypothetical protein